MVALNNRLSQNDPTADTGAQGSPHVSVVSQQALESLVAIAIEEVDRENDIRRRMKAAVKKNDTAAVMELAKLWTLPDGFNSDN